jgi:hypothetical protein
MKIIQAAFNLPLVAGTYVAPKGRENQFYIFMHHRSIVYQKHIAANGFMQHTTFFGYIKMVIFVITRQPIGGFKVVCQKTEKILVLNPLPVKGTISPANTNTSPTMAAKDAALGIPCWQENSKCKVGGVLDGDCHFIFCLIYST